MLAANYVRYTPPGDHPDAAVRPMSDLDIWVQRHDWPQTWQIMVELGVAGSLVGAGLGVLVSIGLLNLLGRTTNFLLGCWIVWKGAWHFW